MDENGSLSYANVLFGQILEPNVYIWNTMIRGCVKHQFFEMGFEYFVRMVKERVEMDKRSYVFGLKSCEGLEDIRVGESLYCRIWKVGCVGEVIVRNGLMHFYSESHKLGEAMRIFYETEVRDVVSWTSMIDGYVKNDLVDEALKMFDKMCESGVEPNEVTMVAVFSACALKGDLSLGERVHEFAERKGVRFSLNLMNSMLDMYVKCGSLAKAGEIFDKMEVKDVFSWTSMINGYAKIEEVDLARKLFDEMPRKNVVAWNAMIAGYSQNSRPNEALELFLQMENNGLVPMESTLVCALSACAQSGRMNLGLRIYDYYIKQQLVKLSIILGNAFVDMYAKCGNIRAAREIFDEMPKKDLVSYNSIIVAYASHGHAHKALHLFEQMINVGFKPDEITLVGVLSACAHGGLVKMGWEYFTDMSRFGLKPGVEHYACMTELLSRVGILEEAYQLIKTMPMEPDKAVWGGLLSGCRIHGNIELGKIAAENLIILDPNDSGIYALLASLCAKKRKWDDVSMVRSMMREKGVKKNPGSSLIEVEGKFHEFLVADESHPETEDIYKVLQVIFSSSKVEDFALDSRYIDAFS